MTATTTGWDHTILVHLERLRSPLGVVLLIAAFSLLLALLLIRQRRQRNLASVRGRTAVLSTYTASARRRQALEEAQNEHKSVTAQVGEFVRRRRPPNLSEILGVYSILPIEGRQNSDDAGDASTFPVLKRFR